MNAALRSELLALAQADEKLRALPAEDALHERHAERIAAIVAAHGWPDADTVGDDGCEALWRVVMNVAGAPDLQRGLLAELSRREGKRGDRPLARAMLEDRVRVLEGRPQRYATQFDFDDDGVLQTFGPVEDPKNVDRHRAQLGLPPLGEDLERRRRAVGAQS